MGGGMSQRESFAKLAQVLDPPDLIEIQKRSYAGFLQLDAPKNRRDRVGLQAAFLETFPIESPDGRHRLRVAHYTIRTPT